VRIRSANGPNEKLRVMSECRGSLRKRLLIAQPFVDRMMLLMERISGRMLAKTEGRYELLETIDSDDVVSEASGVFGTRAIDIAAVSTTSLLVPVTQRRSSHVPIMFSHRAFHEYFTARHAKRVGMDDAALPEPVRRMLANLGDA
jgi:hypothetical protein